MGVIELTRDVRETNRLLALILQELQFANGRTATPTGRPVPPQPAMPRSGSGKTGDKVKPGPRGPITIILGATPEAAAVAHRGFLKAYPGAPVHATSLPAQEPLAIEPGDVVHVFGLAAADAAAQAPVRDFIYRSMMAGSNPTACAFDTQVTFMP